MMPWCGEDPRKMVQLCFSVSTVLQTLLEVILAPAMGKLFPGA